MLFHGNQRQAQWPASFAAVAACLVGLMGCASAPPQPQVTVDDESPAFAASGAAALEDRWWQAFGNPRLNEQVERATRENFTLQAAWEALRAARATVRFAEADLYPTLDGTAEARAEEGWGESEQTGFSVGLDAAYEVDLWGRIEAQAQAERFRADASRFDYRATALLLSAQVTQTWYRLITTRAQLELIAQQVQTNEQVLDLLRGRFEIGQIRSADVLRQRQLLEATREQAILARQDEALLTHQLAVLTGRPPQGVEVATGTSLPELPPMPGTGLPAELVERRPDVQLSYALLRAADRDLAAAVSDQYPRLTLLASLSSSVSNAGDLFTNWLGSIAGRAVAPLLDGGRRRAEVDRTAAVRDLRVAEYAGSVLTAFREVEDALALERTRARRLRNLEQRLELSRNTYDQLRTQYINGVTDYLAVLDVLTDQQALERTLLAARLDLIEARIALHRALAGGFDTPREQEESSVALESSAHE